MHILLFLKRHPLLRNTIELGGVAVLGAVTFLSVDAALVHLKTNQGEHLFGRKAGANAQQQQASRSPARSSTADLRGAQNGGELRGVQISANTNPGSGAGAQAGGSYRK